MIDPQRRSQAEMRDEAWQMGVLVLILDLHPSRLSAPELQREMLAGDEDFGVVDSHSRAVRDLIAAGLLRRDGDSIVPTRAALHFASLAHSVGAAGAPTECRFALCASRRGCDR